MAGLKIIWDAVVIDILGSFEAEEEAFVFSSLQYIFSSGSKTVLLSGSKT